MPTNKPEDSKSNNTTEKARSRLDRLDEIFTENVRVDEEEKLNEEEKATVARVRSVLPDDLWNVVFQYRMSTPLFLCAASSVPLEDPVRFIRNPLLASVAYDRAIVEKIKNAKDVEVKISASDWEPDFFIAALIRYVYECGYYFPMSASAQGETKMLCSNDYEPDEKITAEQKTVVDFIHKRLSGDSYKTHPVASVLRSVLEEGAPINYVDLRKVYSSLISQEEIQLPLSNSRHIDRISKWLRWPTLLLASSVYTFFAKMRLNAIDGSLGKGLALLPAIAYAHTHFSIYYAAMPDMGSRHLRHGNRGLGVSAHSCAYRYSRIMSNIQIRAINVLIGFIDSLFFAELLELSNNAASKIKFICISWVVATILSAVPISAADLAFDVLENKTFSRVEWRHLKRWLPSLILAGIPLAYIILNPVQVDLHPLTQVFSFARPLNNVNSNLTTLLRFAYPLTQLPFIALTSVVTARPIVNRLFPQEVQLAESIPTSRCGRFNEIIAFPSRVLATIFVFFTSLLITKSPVLAVIEALTMYIAAGFPEATRGFGETTVTADRRLRFFIPFVSDVRTTPRITIENMADVKVSDVGDAGRDDLDVPLIPKIQVSEFKRR